MLAKTSNCTSHLVPPRLGHITPCCLDQPVDCHLCCIAHSRHRPKPDRHHGKQTGMQTSKGQRRKHQQKVNRLA
ncbi:hypothetical protein BC831DRAFT_487881 [Entophlyctis helioformis]|nr:hypothetical protein BC831DRAFT_487881 [Entophlyctis helioformis]